MENKKEKFYKISERDLLYLLEAYHKLSVLEWDGVDNWEWYMEGRANYLKDCGVTEEEIDNDFDFEDLAKRDLKDYEVIT